MSIRLVLQRLVRRLLIGAAAIAVVGWTAIVGFSQSASAAAPGGYSSFAAYTATNADGGIYWRSQPDWNTPIEQPGYGFYNGTGVALDCYEFGGPAGPYNNTLWYYGEWYSGSGMGEGWINDHYLDTPGTATDPQPQGPACASQGQTSAAPAATTQSATPSASSAAPSADRATSAQWVDTPNGPTLSITPSGDAQLNGPSAAQSVMASALSQAGAQPLSSASYGSLMEQLQCHLAYAIKTPYNLDSWRPSVPWAQELADLCNPPNGGIGEYGS